MKYFYCLLICLVTILVNARASNADLKKPNIVFIMCDDLGFGEISGLNNDPDIGKIQTPNIDALIDNGMTFTDAHSGSSVCTPTRYGLLTGRYAWRTKLQSGVVSGHAPCLIEPEKLTLAEMLKKKDYSTGIVGKWHLNYIYADPQTSEKLDKSQFNKKGALEPPLNTLIKDGPLDHGFDYFFGYHHSRDMQTVVENNKVIAREHPITMLPAIEEKSIAFIQRHSAAAKNGEPFFLYVPISSPHSPVVPAKKWQGKSGLNEHADFVMQTDYSVGQIVNAIDDAGLRENTLIVFTSDNGTSGPSSHKEALQKMGHYPSWILRGSKADIWDGGHRVPFIVRWPAMIEGGSFSGELLCHTDFMPTVADIIGFDLPDDAAEDGFSYTTVFSKGKRLKKRPAVVHHSVNGKFAVRDNEWKLVLCPGSGGWSNPKDGKAKEMGLPDIQLYNMKIDLSERQNLYEKQPEIIKGLVKTLQEFVENGRSTPGKKLKNDIENIDIWKGIPLIPTN